MATGELERLALVPVELSSRHHQREEQGTERHRSRRKACIEPSDERMGSVAGRTARSLRSPRAAIGESDREPRRRSDDAVSGALTQGSRSLTVQKVDVGSWSVCAPKHTAGELDTLPFRAAIWDRLAVDWWLSGPPTYFVSRRLQI